MLHCSMRLSPWASGRLPATCPEQKARTMYELHNLPEVIGGIVFFALIAALGWYFTAHKDISDDSRTFR